jgi:serine/threonine-protein kinase
MLQAGTKFGSYEIAAPIGAGGMGEVYRALDTRLRRHVAVKVLPESFCRDRDRVARFEREARVLAALNCPLIAAIYGIEEVDGRTGLVLELIEGPTLAERLEHGETGSRSPTTLGRWSSRRWRRAYACWTASRGTSCGVT